MAVNEWKKREREQRQRDILDLSENLIFRKGYDYVTMDEIALVCGVSKGTLFVYFKNKESLYHAIVLRGARIMDSYLKKSIIDGKSGLEKTLDLGRAYFMFAFDYPDYYDVYVYSRSNRFSSPDTEWSQEICQLGSDSVRIVCETIHEGIVDGSIRPDINPIEAALFIILTAPGIVKIDSKVTTLLEDQSISHTQFIEDSLNFWTRMLKNSDIEHLQKRKSLD